MEQNVKSVLKLNKLVFDKLSFERDSAPVEHKDDSVPLFKFNLKSKVLEFTKEDYQVTLVLNGGIEGEYKLEISISGFFSLQEEDSISEQIKKDLVYKNTLAILMPYLRGEVSILTAQPNVACVVLPPFNINNLIKKSDES